jgi:DNA-binding NarL/FixJ family response regulator
VADLSNSILIVDDEFLISMHFSAQVEDMGLTVCAVAETAADAISAAERHRPAVVLMDMRLRGEEDGVDAALRIHAQVGSKVIFITGSREQATVDRINSDHPFDILFKPVPDETLRKSIELAIKSGS